MKGAPLLACLLACVAEQCPSFDKRHVGAPLLACLLACVAEQCKLKAFGVASSWVL